MTQRAKACGGERGLTDVYNTMEEGGYRALAAAHERLDAAVASAYGWSLQEVRDPYLLIPRLLKLNAQIAHGGRPYDPFPNTRRGESHPEVDRRLFD